MGDDGDAGFGAGAEPVTDPACSRTDRVVGRGIEPSFGRPFGLEQGEVESSVLRVGFEDFAGLEGVVVVVEGKELVDTGGMGMVLE